MYEKLLLFHQDYGHYHVPCRFKSDPAFSKWVTKQKSALRRDNLSLERKAKLESIGFPGPKPSKRKRAEARAEVDVASDERPSKKPAPAKQGAHIPVL